MAQINFNAQNVAPQTSLEPVPAGWYNGNIVESELKPTKNNDGTLLGLQIKILDGQYAGRVVFDRLNMQNPNPVASEIGQRRLSAYCHATGVIMLQDTQQLHGIPFKMKLSVRKDKDGQYEDSNDVKAIKNISEAVEGQGQAAPAFVPQFAPPAQPQQPAFTPQQQFAPPQFSPPAQPQFQQPQAPQFVPPQTPPQWNPPQQPAQQQPQFVPPQAPVQQPAFTPPQQQFQPPQQPQFQQGGPVSEVPPWAKKPGQ